MWKMINKKEGRPYSNLRSLASGVLISLFNDSYVVWVTEKDGLDSNGAYSFLITAGSIKPIGRIFMDSIN